MVDEDRDRLGELGARLGSRLGSIAKRARELLADVTGQPTVPEELRAPWSDAAQARLGGDPDEALLRLRAALVPEGPAGREHAAMLAARALCHVSGACLLDGGGERSGAATRHGDALRGAPAPALDEEPWAAVGQLTRGVVALLDGQLPTALDHLRRAGAGVERLPELARREVELWIHLVAGQVHGATGHDDRALRELQKARARLPAHAGERVQLSVRLLGVRHLLAVGRAAEADAWIREVWDDGDALDGGGMAAPWRAALARVSAARGDDIAALALLDGLARDEADTARARVAVALLLARPELAAGAREREREREPSADAARAEARPNALLELAVGFPWAREPERHTHAAAPARAAWIVDVLTDAVRTAPPERRDDALEELAHALLRVDGALRPWPAAVVELIQLRVRTEPSTAGEALHVAAALDAVRRRATTMDDAFHPGPPVRLRVRAEPSPSSGPDELSPLRDPAAREAVVAAHRALAEAEYTLARELGPDAADLYVRALTERPGMPEAIEGLARLAAPTVGARLEDVLEASTQLLARLPPRVLGVPLDGVTEALADVIAARERLVRPLTIAIMGEFSSGKSTFVNALLGEAVAPMGVLPTTNTINLFRRGPSRGARIHRRDGSVETLAAEHVEPYLQGLDEVRAASIRHVEIERTGGRMGDAAVVDTPGLHALDPFHEQVARGFIEQADAVVWVFSATRGGAASEAAMLTALHAGGRQVLGVLNKVDTLDDAELSELLGYLRKQLGEVLVDVIPVCARDALAARIEQADDNVGGVAAVEAALERRFLARARELKQSLAQRGVAEALLRAREAVEQTALALEARAQRVEPGSPTGPGPAGSTEFDAAGASATLRAVADAVADAIGEVADPWLREALGLGVLVTGKGRARGPLDPQDRRYLDEVVRDACADALRRGIAAKLGGADADLWSTLIDERFVPWALGFVAGALVQGLVPAALDSAGAAIVRGEAAARAELRQALVPVADALRSHLRGSTVELERELARRMRRRAGAPSAEALRLRSTVVPAIETLAAAAQATVRETATGGADAASPSP